MDEVDRPARVRVRLGQDRRPRPRSALPAFALSNAPSSLPRDRVVGSSCGSPHGPRRAAGRAGADSRTGAAQPPTLSGGVGDPRLAADGSDSECLPIGLDQATRPALAHLVGSHEMSDSFALGGGRHHFFDSRSFSAAGSSIASARSRFSFPFSSSSCFSRLASETSSPPNLAFHP